MYCRHCGKMVEDDAVFCRFCGGALKAEPKAVVRLDQAPGLEALIPANALALWAYYLGISSLICFLSAVPALVLGILGVRYADRHPEARGKVHAWVGIILGGLGTVLWSALIILAIRSSM